MNSHASSYRTRISEISLREDGIIYLKLFDGMDISADDVMEIQELEDKIAGGSGIYLIVDLRDISFGHVERGAFKFAAGNEKSISKKATAFVVNNLPAKLMVNFFTQFYKPVSPNSLFHSLAEAEAWLLNLMKENNAGEKNLRGSR